MGLVTFFPHWFSESVFLISGAISPSPSQATLFKNPQFVFSRVVRSVSTFPPLFPLLIGSLIVTNYGDPPIGLPNVLFFPELEIVKHMKPPKNLIILFFLLPFFTDFD